MYEHEIIRQALKEKFRKCIIHNTNPEQPDPIECGYRELLYDIKRAEKGLPMERYEFSHVKLRGKVQRHFENYGYQFRVIG